MNKKYPRFINNYIYPEYDDYTCLCIWWENTDNGGSVELYKINRYCRIHGSVPKINIGPNNSFKRND